MNFNASSFPASLRASLCALLVPLACLSACSAQGDEDGGAFPWQVDSKTQIRNLNPPTPALWEVTSETGEQGWLFGTVHALPEDLNWRTPTLDNVVKNSGVLLVEIANLSDTSANESAFYAVSHTAGLPPLTQRVPAKDRPLLANIIEKSGLSQSDLEGVEIWAASLMLTSRLRTNDASEGADLALLADHDHAEGLEGYAAQYGAFDGLSETAQIELLLSVAKEVEAGPEEDRLDAWLEGDMDRLEATTITGFLEHNELRDALLTQRNHNWLSSVARSVTNGERPLVAVGAAHMLGEDGLPQLLAESGFDVRRIQ